MESIGLVGIIVILLSALWRIAHGKGDATDAERAFWHGVNELSKWQKGKGE
jgi:hypothetical protein